MPIKKQYLKSKPVCKVTFQIPRQQSRSAENIHVVGDFNNWSPKVTPMKRFKNGNFSLTLDLEQDRQYEFRYLFDGKDWANEVDEDGRNATPFEGTFNSVIIL